jgi:Tol biopolymer transport system component
MPLPTGTHLGPYVVEAPIGAGGMGEVYRARDSKLGRQVALKVLPELVARDSDRLARFRREAQVLASLNHPNIAQIHGLEDSGETHALVLELVEGPTLADRIAGGPIPLEEALLLARQIVDALEYAHEQAVVHRDLKPANIKVRPDGTVKVLDFGLAKALAPEGANGTTDAMNSPTLTARGTQLGVIVGTAAYMAPEQARGRPADRRADVWAFGIVLYEMLTGRRAFEGDDISITLASVLKDDVDWKAVPADLPASVRRLLRRCLEKDPKRRLSAIADARLELNDADASTDIAAAAAPVAARNRQWIPWTVAVLASATAVTSLLLWAPWREPEHPQPIRLSTEVGADGTLAVNLGAGAVISPDGQVAVFVVDSNGRNRLYVRRLEQLHTVLLPGTEDAMSPFFSADSQSIAFFTPGKLKKISVNGGAVTTVCDAENGRGGSWGADGTIVFQPMSNPGSQLHTVSADGGTSVALGTKGLAAQRWPQILPGGRAVIYSGNSVTISWDTGSIMAQALPSGAPKLLVDGAFYGRYVNGHLLYIRNGTLYSVPFDAERLETHGEHRPLIEGVLSAVNTGGAQYSVSDSGTLLYVPGKFMGDNLPVTWIDREGKTSVLRAEAADWWSPSFSPDRRQLAMTIGYGYAADVWTYDWARDRPTQLTFGRGVDSSPVWTPDGRRIAYASAPDENTQTTNIYWKRADGSGDAQRLTESATSQVPFSFHPDGKYLAYIDRGVETMFDVMILPIEGDEKTGWKTGKPWPFAATAALENAPAFSPDGRWLAYSSTESGRAEIYVRPFPSGEGLRKVSTEPGGMNPRWSPNRERPELFYAAPVSGQIAVMALAYRSEGDTFLDERPRRWYPHLITATRPARPFDVHPDGDRIAIAVPPVNVDPQQRPVFVFNFFEELRRGR